MEKRETCYGKQALIKKHPATSSLSALHQAWCLLHVDDKLEDLLFPFIPQIQRHHYL